MMNTGEKIKMLRKRAGMTQAELASKLGLKDSVIAKYENGRIPDLKRTTIAGLAKVFNVSPMFFMDDTVTSIGDYQFKKAKTNTEIIEIETMYRAMTNEPHECRYSFATYSAECDMDSRIRKFIMGHSQGNITDDVYTDISKLIPKMVREIGKFDPMKGL